MPVARKTITLSAQQDAWVKSRIESGDYTNEQIPPAGARSPFGVRASCARPD